MLSRLHGRALDGVSQTERRDPRRGRVNVVRKITGRPRKHEHSDRGLDERDCGLAVQTYGALHGYPIPMAEGLEEE